MDVELAWVFPGKLCWKSHLALFNFNLAPPPPPPPTHRTLEQKSDGSASFPDHLRQQSSLFLKMFPSIKDISIFSVFQWQIFCRFSRFVFQRFVFQRFVSEGRGGFQRLGIKSSHLFIPHSTGEYHQALQKESSSVTPRLCPTEGCGVSDDLPGQWVTGR